MNTERILIVLDIEGKFKAASAQDHGGLPISIEKEELAGLFPEINILAMAQVERLNNDLSEKNDKIKELDESINFIQKQKEKLELDIANKDQEYQSKITELTNQLTAKENSQSNVESRLTAIEEKLKEV